MSLSTRESRPPDEGIHRTAWSRLQQAASLSGGDFLLSRSEDLSEAPDRIAGLSARQHGPDLEASTTEVGNDVTGCLMGAEFKQVPPRCIDQHNGRLRISCVERGVQLPSEVLDIGKEDVSSGSHQQHLGRDGYPSGARHGGRFDDIERAPAQLEEQGQHVDQDSATMPYKAPVAITASAAMIASTPSRRSTLKICRRVAMSTSPFLAD
jgi:hypothetical protein